MTKSEALQSLREGKKLRHQYFTEGEWMKEIESYYYKFEDGALCTTEEFWSVRTVSGWEEGWEVVE